MEEKLMLRRWRWLGASALGAFMLTACGGSSQTVTPEEQFGNLVSNTPNTIAAEDEPTEALALTEDGETSTTTVQTAPPTTAISTTTTAADTAALSVSTSDVGGEPRVTSEGLRVGLIAEVSDFGRGPEDTVWIAASLGGTSLSVVIDEDRVADTTSIEDGTWAANGGIAVVRAEASSQVVEVRLTSSDGGVDRVTPDADGFAVLGVRTERPAGLLIEGFDAAGELVGACEHDGSFFRCSE